MQPLRIFIGYDSRQPVAFTALQHSIHTHATKPVSITPLIIDQLPIKRTGLTPFTYSRFLVPWLCDYEGWALFLDIDIILNDDIVKLFDMAQANDRYHVMVSKNEKRFEWASVMLFNNSKCTSLTPEYIETAEGLHHISWCKDEEIGDLPHEWNHLVGYDKPNPDAKLVHYTQGIPAFPETNTSEHTDLWVKNHIGAISATNWDNLMGVSIHAVNLDLGEGKEIRVPKYFLHESGESVRPEFRDKLKQLVETKYV